MSYPLPATLAPVLPRIFYTLKRLSLSLFKLSHVIPTSFYTRTCLTSNLLHSHFSYTCTWVIQNLYTLTWISPNLLHSHMLLSYYIPLLRAHMSIPLPSTHSFAHARSRTVYTLTCSTQNLLHSHMSCPEPFTLSHVLALTLLHFFVQNLLHSHMALL